MKKRINLISFVLEMIMYLCLIFMSVDVVINGGATVFQYISMAINCAIWIFISAMYRRASMKHIKEKE